MYQTACVVNDKGKCLHSELIIDFSKFLSYASVLNHGNDKTVSNFSATLI